MKTLIIAAIAVILLSPSAHAQSKAETDKAMSILKKWQAKNGEPIVNEEGRVLYTFGESMPQVICAPLTLCDIKMQPGENIVSVRVGDRVRWHVTPARSGTGSTVSEHLIVKPIQAGLKTTLFVGTDLRVYVIELISDPVNFMSKVGFLYNDSDLSGSESAGSDIALLPPQAPEIDPAMLFDPNARTEVQVEGHEVLAHKLNFDYRISGPNMPWKPIRVYDDGTKTFIDMDPNRVSARELPVFLVNDTDQRGNLINVRYIPHDSRYVVDGLFDKGSLVLGVGRKRAKIAILRISAHDTNVQ